MSSDPTAYVAKREALLAMIRAVLIEDLSVALAAEQIDPDTPLIATGLALDSIDAVDLVVGIEQRTGVRILDDDDGRLALRSLNMVVNYLLAREEASA
jgi:acyl carrier protein